MGHLMLLNGTFEIGGVCRSYFKKVVLQYPLCPLSLFLFKWPLGQTPISNIDGLRVYFGKGIFLRMFIAHEQMRG